MTSTSLSDRSGRGISLLLAAIALVKRQLFILPVDTAFVNTGILAGEAFT